MNLVYSEKENCPTCGQEKSVESGEVCDRCYQLKQSMMQTFLGFVKGFFLNMTSLADIMDHGRNFLGHLQPWERKRLEELAVVKSDVESVKNGKMTIQEYLQKYSKRPMDRFHLLRRVVHDTGKNSFHLNIQDPTIPPRRMFDAIRLDVGDRKLSRFYFERNPGNALERARQTANKIFFVHRLEQLRADYARGGEGSAEALRLAKDYFDAAIFNGDWWSFEPFADFFKSIGELSLHHQAWAEMDKYWLPPADRKRSWKPSVKEVSEFARCINSNNHI